MKKMKTESAMVKVLLLVEVSIIQYLYLIFFIIYPIFQTLQVINFKMVDWSGLYVHTPLSQNIGSQTCMSRQKLYIFGL